MKVLILTDKSRPNNSEKIFNIFPSLKFSPEIIQYEIENETEIILELLKKYQETIFIIKADSIINENKIFQVLQEAEENKIDILFLNKIKDECENQIKINQNLRFSVKPNSVQGVVFNKKAISHILEYYKKEENFINYLNFIASNSKANNFKIAVSSQNIIEFDINLASSINDFEKLIQCDIPNNKNKIYSTGMRLFIFIIIIVVIFLIIVYFFTTFQR